MPAAASTTALNLLGCAVGQPLRIERIPADLACAQRLRELGIVEGAELLVLRRSDPLVILAKEARVALDLATARRIEVSLEPV